VHILSFGGGVNSVALMIWLVENQQPLDEVIFADTGAEVPETYGYLKITEKYLDDRGYR
jgi:3'-phosphoadenosine 5'-phosphosulfate sulfotransferase (PAPS reductase)/FAD synthetase